MNKWRREKSAQYFLVACTRLYKSLWWSVRPPVCSSIPLLLFFAVLDIWAQKFALLLLPNSTRLVLPWTRPCYFFTRSIHDRDCLMPQSYNLRSDINSLFLLFSFFSFLSLSATLSSLPTVNSTLSQPRSFSPPSILSWINGFIAGCHVWINDLIAGCFAGTTDNWIRFERFTFSVLSLSLRYESFWTLLSYYHTDTVGVSTV